jgi:hypothetical protein
VKGVAFQKPAAAQQQTFDQSKLDQGLTGIFRATGIETAGMRQKGRDENLIAPQEYKGKLNCQPHD